MKLLYRLSVIVLMAALTACALSPQKVTIRPDIDLSDVNTVGNDATVSLETIDNRPSRVIGTRGGVYASTSEISTAEDIRTPIRTELTEALQQMGYQVVASGQASDSVLKIFVDAIKYEVQEGNVTDVIEITVTLRAVCKAGKREYTGRYRSTRSREAMTKPKPEENEAMINATMSHVLKRVLTDQQLLEFMRGETDAGL